VACIGETGILAGGPWGPIGGMAEKALPKRAATGIRGRVFDLTPAFARATGRNAGVTSET